MWNKRREQEFVLKLLFAMAVQECEEESALGSLWSWRSKAEISVRSFCQCLSLNSSGNRAVQGSLKWDCSVKPVQHWGTAYVLLKHWRVLLNRQNYLYSILVVDNLPLFKTPPFYLLSPSVAVKPVSNSVQLGVSNLCTPICKRLYHIASKVHSEPTWNYARAYSLHRQLSF